MSEVSDPKANWETPEQKAARRERGRLRRQRAIENRRKVMSMVLEGKTREEISAETGLAISSLSAILQRAGFPLGPKGQGKVVRVSTWVSVRQLRVIRSLSEQAGIPLSAMLGRIIREIEASGDDEARRWLGKLAKAAKPKKVAAVKPSYGH